MRDEYAKEAVDRPQRMTGDACAVERRMTAREQLHRRAQNLRDEADQLEALARHLPPSIDSDHAANWTLDRMIQKLAHG